MTIEEAKKEIQAIIDAVNWHATQDDPNKVVKMIEAKACLINCIKKLGG